MNYDLITDEKGFAYAVVKYSKTITTLYTAEGLQMFSTKADTFNDLVYKLQESKHTFSGINQVEFEQAKRELGYIG